MSTTRKVRPDFSSVAYLFERLRLIGAEFDAFNMENWSHLKNQEDFEKVYELSDQFRTAFEDVYGDGRDCAVAMSDYASAFDDVSRFPTLKSYTEFMRGTWVFQIDLLKANIDAADNLAKKLQEKCPWAVHAMSRLFRKQMEMLEAVRNVVLQLENSPLYKSETTLIPMTPETSSPTSIVVHGSGNQVFGVVSGSQVHAALNFGFSPVWACFDKTDREKGILR